MKEDYQDMDTSDWAVPPPTEKMLKARIVELEELHLLDAVDQENRTKMLAHIATLEAALDKADAMAAVMSAEFAYDGPEVEAAAAYQIARSKVKP